MGHTMPDQKSMSTLKIHTRYFFLVLLLLSVLLFFGINHMVEENSAEFKEIINPYSHSGLILDTPGCKVPKLDPFDESVKHIFVAKEPYVCKGMPTFLITQPNATLVLNETALNIAYNISAESISCSYKAIYRQHEPKGYFKENTFSFSDSKVLQFGVPLGEEFLEVECKLGDKNLTQLIPLVPIKAKVKNIKTESSKSDNLNVILIGIDSVSKLNFLRHFKRTHEFLTSNMSAFDMKGYTKVGDNTFPNLVPMLTGHFVEHYWNESINNMFFDKLDLIWKEYSSKGYITFYAEDAVYSGTFQYLKRGFKNPPTDYYFRPLGLAMAESKLMKEGGGYCLNDQLEMEIIFGYLKDFLKTMVQKQSFSFTMVSSITHDYINEAGYADVPTYNLLKHLHESGITNRSLIAFFSDHGLRFGPITETYVGKFEERMPIMYLALPNWYLARNENFAKNLKQNQHRLVTLFDLHATLFHLLNTSKCISEEEKSTITPNGLSLMSEISEYRTCDMAKILPHWCACQVYQSVSKNDTLVKEVAVAIIDEINKKLDSVKEKCFLLEIENIIDARVGEANEMVLEFVKKKNEVVNSVDGEGGQNVLHFLLTIEARPGGGVFEGTVRYDTEEKKLNVLGISRINKYGTQSWCINKQSLKTFCYCK